MIDYKLLDSEEKNPETGKTFLEEYKISLSNRGWDPSEIGKIIALNETRRNLLAKAEEERARQNRVSEEIANLKRAKQDASALIQDMQSLSLKVKELQGNAQKAEEDLLAALLVLPNRCHHSVPIGKSADDNKVVRTWGAQKKFSFTPMDHLDIGEKLKIIDVERAGKVSGARFAFLRAGAARLERALIQFMMDTHSNEHGYEEMIPPFIVNSQSLVGTSNFPKFFDDVFHLVNTDYHLIPTAEVPVTNFYAKEMLEAADLPKSFVAYSPCFRSEAGSYGRDTKGLIRQHQFNKVELVKFCTPETSYEEHDKLTQHAERILQKLELPYRTMVLSTGDISFGAAKCYDLEVWLPSQNAFREISSCSNFEDFQARRADIRYRPAGVKAKPRYVHTLNGSGIAVGRTLIAILENYQQEDGSVLIPEVLHPYMSGTKRLNPVS